MSLVSKQDIDNYLKSNILCDFTKVKIIETFEIFKLIIPIDSIEKLFENINTEQYLNLFKIFFDMSSTEKNDKSCVKVLGNEECLKSFETLNEIENFKYNYDLLNDDKAGELELNILKNGDKYTTIYSLNDLTVYLNDEKTITDIFKLFFNSTKTFKVITNESFSIKTKSFYFYSHDKFDDCKLTPNDEVLKKINENSHFANAASIKFLPEDFYYKFDDTFLCKNFQVLLEKLTLSLLLRVFADISEFDGNKLFYKLFGYKTIQCTYQFPELNTKCVHDYFDSYNDLFLDTTNFISKIGLARNVISLHIVNQDFTDIKGNIQSSIKSNYNIYLKENVKKYIDIKDKITDKLFTLSKGFDAIIEDLSKSFKSTFYTLTTILLSLILLKLIKGTANTSLEVFTVEVYFFLVALLGAMYLFKLYTVSEMEQRKNRLFEQYKQLKKRYVSLLDEEDLNEIFGYDEFESQNNTYIQKQKDTYDTFWDLSLLSYLLVFTGLTFSKFCVNLF